MQRTSTKSMNILTSDVIQKTLLNVSTQEARKNDLNKIKSLNIYEINPMDALNILNELKNKLK